MSKFEDRAFKVGKSKPTVDEMKNRLARMKGDLEQISARKPDAAVLAALRTRIRELEGEIAEAAAEAERKRQQRQAASDGDDGGEMGGSAFVRSTGGRFPPRGRPGR